MTSAPLPDIGKNWCHIAVVNDTNVTCIYLNGRRVGDMISANQIDGRNSPANLRLGATELTNIAGDYQLDIGDLRISCSCLYEDDFNPPRKFEQRADTLVLLDFANRNKRQINDLSKHRHHGIIRGGKWVERNADSASMPIYENIIKRPLGIEHTELGFVPPFRRWNIKFFGASLQSYAQQLDFFQVELGVIGKNETEVQYLAKLSKPNPITRNGARDLEKRVYFTLKEEEQPSFDQQLLEKSGIRTSGHVVMRFIDNHLSALLMNHERKRAKELGKTIQEIEQTIFLVKPKGKDWDIEVAEMQFR